MALTIPPHEIDTCLQLARPAFAAFALSNDLFSFEKEKEVAFAHANARAQCNSNDESSSNDSGSGRNKNSIGSNGSTSTSNSIPSMINAIYVLMYQHSITEEPAKVLCQEHIKRLVAEAVRICEETRSPNPNPSPSDQQNDKDETEQSKEVLSEDTKTYVEAALLSVSGNLVWSIGSPRYRI